MTGEKPNYAAMTVNERLCAAELMDDFDKAVQSRDRNLIMQILAKVEVSQADVAAIINKLIKH